MPINQQISIRQSVGAQGRNDPADVRIIQKRLNDLMRPPRIKLAEDGRSGPKTEGMIRDFQKNAMRAPQADGRVDPGGATLRALNDAASEGKWGGASVPAAAPAATISYPRNATPGEKAALDKMVSATGGDKPALEFLDFFVQTPEYSLYKNVLTAVGSAQWLTEFFALIRVLKQAGMTSRDLALIFKIFIEARDVSGLSRFIGVLKTSPNMAKGLPKLAGSVGSALNVVAVILCAIEVANHVQNDRYGAAVSEIYGAFMSIAIPWAGFIDGVQTVIYAAIPGLQGKASVNQFFRLLNAVNPIGAGKTGVDAVGTIIEVAVVSFQKGTFDSARLDLLVVRMKQTPMSVFVEWGEALGDYTGDKFGDFYYQHFLK